VSTRKALKCKTPGCSKPHHAHGYCQHCYDNLRKKAGAAKASVKTARAAVAPKASDSRKPDANVPAPRGIRQGRAATGAGTGAAAGQEAPKSGRLALLKARHEAMKREIDQIREDLESDEED